VYLIPSLEIRGGEHMTDNFNSTKFVMSCIGIGLCVVWAAFQLEKEYLIIALGFVATYTAGNVIQKFSKP
jgi:hypothetical protein